MGLFYNAPEPTRLALLIDSFSSSLYHCTKYACFQLYCRWSYWRCAHSACRRVYLTVGRPSVCPIRPPHVAVTGLLLWAQRPEILMDCCTAGGTALSCAAAAPQLSAGSATSSAVRRRKLNTD